MPVRGSPPSGELEVDSPLRARLVRFARPIVGDLPAAEDVVQDACESWVRLTDEERRVIRHLEAYLMVVVKRKALDLVRSRRRTTFNEEGESLATPDLHPGPEKTLEHEQELDRLIRPLSPKCREALVLYKVFGFTVKEIAAHMGNSPSAVQKLLARATPDHAGSRACTRGPQCNLTEEDHG